MTLAWQYWTREIARRLSEQLEIEVAPSELVMPPDRKHGDLAFGCFRLAKERRISPAALATEIATKFDGSRLDIARAEAVGPYVNFTLAVGPSVHRVVRDIEVANGKYGATDLGKNQELLLEYAQPNSHKEIHVGHLRNFVLGVSLHQILSAAGWNVVALTYHGDVGAHVAKCLWWIVTSGGFSVTSFSDADADKLLSDIPSANRTGKYLGAMYAESSRQLELNPDAKEQISSVQRALESHVSSWDKLWRETRRWSLDEIAKTFDELGVKANRQYLESEVVDRGQEMVDELIAKGIAKESQGAIVVDLEEKKLGVFLIRKSDGTSLYATKDLALAEMKIAEYPKASRSLIMVDNRQMLYFKQLFETLRMLDIRPVPEFVGYEFVTLKTGAMASREGNVVTFQSFYEEVLSYTRAEVLTRHPEWNEGKVQHTAWSIAMAGMKFGMLKQDNDKVFTFDLEQALAFDGATGPYCQYAATRLGSILRKGKFDGSVADEKLTEAFDHDSEKALAFVLAMFPHRVEQAASELRPSVIAQWCVEAAQRINDFYRDVPVLESKGELLEGRFRLAAAARQTLVRGLEMLGIPMPDEM